MPETTSGQQTALINIKPDRDIAYVSLVNEVSRLREYATKIVIASKGDVELATADLSIMANLKKAIEEKRQEYVKPINTHLQEINATFKAVSEPLAEADKIYRQKVTAFYAEEERRVNEAKEIARMEAEAAARKAALEGKPAPEPAKIETPAPISDKAKTDVGDSSMMTVRKWEVIDFSKVPDELKVIDAGKVTKLVKAGIGAIAGIRIYEEKTLRVEARK